MDEEFWDEHEEDDTSSSVDLDASDDDEALFKEFGEDGDYSDED